MSLLVMPERNSTTFLYHLSPKAAQLMCFGTGFPPGCTLPFPMVKHKPTGRAGDKASTASDRLCLRHTTTTGFIFRPQARKSDPGSEVNFFQALPNASSYKPFLPPPQGSQYFLPMSTPVMGTGALLCRPVHELQMKASAVRRGQSPCAKSITAAPSVTVTCSKRGGNPGTEEQTPLRTVVGVISLELWFPLFFNDG